jgi:hypothetical protein
MIIFSIFEKRFSSLSFAEKRFLTRESPTGERYTFYAQFSAGQRFGSTASPVLISSKIL